MMPFLIAALVVSAVAAVFDLKTGSIPNWLTLPALLLAPIAHYVYGTSHGMDTSEAGYEAGFSVAGALVTGIVPVILFRQSAIGGGDVKILAALGALCQPSMGLEVELYTFMAAMVIAPARLAYDGKLLATLKNTGFLMLNPVLPKDKRRTVEPEVMSWFRLGPCILIGVAVTVYLHWGST
jgi:prepilin peptidase CpaA